MHVEIVRGMEGGRRRREYFHDTLHIDPYTSAVSTIVMSKEARHDRHTVSLLTGHMVFCPNTGAWCWLAMWLRIYLRT